MTSPASVAEPAASASLSKQITTRLSSFTAMTLAIVNCVMLYADRASLAWWYVIVIPFAYLAADLLSGLVHWLADTFGNAETPLLGRRFILPFRLQHEDSNDIVRRGFFDLNGDVALGVLPLLFIATFLPTQDEGTLLARACLTALALALLPTNQIHQWAHRVTVPQVVMWLQRSGVILSRETHMRHHTPPFSGSYCITSGWCNRLLDKFIRRRREKTILANPSRVQGDE